MWLSCFHIKQCCIVTSLLTLFHIFAIISLIQRPLSVSLSMSRDLHNCVLCPLSRLGTPLLLFSCTCRFCTRHSSWYEGCLCVLNPVTNTVPPFDSYTHRSWRWPKSHLSFMKHMGLEKCPAMFFSVSHAFITVTLHITCSINCTAYGSGSVSAHSPIDLYKLFIFFRHRWWYFTQWLCWFGRSHNVLFLTFCDFFLCLKPFETYILWKGHTSHHLYQI